VISSVAGDRGRQSNYIYGSAKGALNIYLQGLRNRLHKANVQVLTIKPGFVDTPMTHEFKKGLLWVKPQTIAKDIVKGITHRRHEIYTPGFWRFIMLIIKLIPECLFKRLKL
jgi:short-subunit dehydrogenase